MSSRTSGWLAGNEEDVGCELTCSCWSYVFLSFFFRAIHSVADSLSFRLQLMTRIVPNLANERTKRADLADMKERLCPHLPPTTTAAPPSTLRYAFDDGSTPPELLKKAFTLFRDEYLLQPRFSSYLVAFDCWSSSSDVLSDAAPCYRIRFAIGVNSFVSLPAGFVPAIARCSCPTFDKGSARSCSHIGAALYWFHSRWSQSSPMPALPSSLLAIEEWLSQGSYFPFSSLSSLSSLFFHHFSSLNLLL